MNSDVKVVACMMVIVSDIKKFLIIYVRLSVALCVSTRGFTRRKLSSQQQLNKFSIFMSKTN